MEYLKEIEAPGRSSGRASYKACPSSLQRLSDANRVPTKTVRRRSLRLLAEIGIQEEGASAPRNRTQKVGERSSFGDQLPARSPKKVVRPEFFRVGPIQPRMRFEPRSEGKRDSDPISPRTTSYVEQKRHNSWGA